MRAACRRATARHHERVGAALGRSRCVASCSCRRGTPRPTTTAASGTASTTTRARWSRSTPRRARRAGTSRPCTTTSGTTTCRRSRRSSSGLGQAGPCPRSCRPRSSGTCSCSIAARASRCCPVEERPVPQAGAVPGETLAPTQPFPLRPASLHPATFSAGRGLRLHALGSRRMPRGDRGLRSDGIFTPPSAQGSVQYPGMAGGMNWGGVAVDPERGLLIANTQRIATTHPPADRATRCAPSIGDRPPTTASSRRRARPTRSSAGRCSRRSARPATRRPGARSPRSTSRRAGCAGRCRSAPRATSRRGRSGSTRATPNLGGPLVTAGGLVFIGATTDFFLRAFEVETGRELWKGAPPDRRRTRRR